MRCLSREVRAAVRMLPVLLGLLGQQNSARAQANEGPKWVPLDAAVFVDLRVAELWKQPTVKEFLDRLAKSKVDLNQEFEKHLGLNPKEIERVLLFMRPTSTEPVLVVTTHTPSKEKLITSQLPGAVAKQHAGKSYHVSAGGERALVAVNDKCLVLGSGKDILQALEQHAARVGDSPYHKAVGLAKDDALLVGYLDLTAFGDQLKAGLPPQAAAVLPLFEAKRTELTLVSGATTRLSVTMTCADDEDAKKKAQSLRTTVDVLRQFIPIGQVELGKQKPKGDDHKWLFEQAETFLKELLEGCKTAQIEPRGRAVHGQMQVKVNVGTLLTIAAGAFVVTEVSVEKRP